MTYGYRNRLASYEKSDSVQRGIAQRRVHDEGGGFDKFVLATDDSADLN